MGSGQYLDLLPSSGYTGRGIGASVFVSRNRSIALGLTVADAMADTVTTIELQTGAYQAACKWRRLGSTLVLNGAGVASVSAAGADAFVRAVYDVASPSGDVPGLALNGSATLVIAESAPRTGTGQTAAIDMAQYRGAQLSLVVESGPVGAELLVTLERSANGDAWESVTDFPVAAGASEFDIETADTDRFLRVKWKAGGASPWVFGVRGESHLIYATPRDRSLLGVRLAAIPDTSSTQYLAALRTASTVVSSYYTRYNHPLIAWDSDTKQATIALADWQLAASRGNLPDKSLYSAEADRWMQHLRFVGGVEPGGGGRKILPSNIKDSTEPTIEGQVKRWSFESLPNAWSGAKKTAGF